MGLMDWCVGIGSALASFLYLWWSRVDNYADPIFRLTAWVSKLTFPFSPYLQLTISQDGPERFQRSEFFLAVEAYLSHACANRARKLKADIGRDSKNLQVYVDDHEEVVDKYGDATVWWYASKKQPRSIFSVFPNEEESRFYQVVFHRRHRDLVLDHYLPHVLDAGRDAAIRNRPRRLFTNKPSCRWKTYGANASWNHVAFQHPATFKTLAMDPDQKQAIIDDLEAFREAKDYYTEVGRAWKRGYFIYGPPGTGKSTMIAAMANFLDYDVYDLELTAVKNNTELRNLFIETKTKSIIVIEDIDCSVDLTGKRKDRKSKGEDDDNPLDPTDKDEGTKVTLSGVLNAVDGLWSACGDERIIIFTTNNKDKLDPALIRPGRMDKHIEMSYCRYKAFKVLAKNFLGVDEHKLFDEIRCLLEEIDVSPADVAENLMPMSRKVKRSPDACLEGLVQALKKKANEEAAAKALADANKASEMEAATPKEEGRGEEDKTSDPEGAKMDQARKGHDLTAMGSPSSSLVQAHSNEWILDTSSLIHHTFNLQMLHDLTTDDDLQNLERGSVETERFKVPDVHYIQGATRNVISVAQLARRHGLVTVFEPTCGYVRDLATRQEVGRAHLSKGGVYVLDYLLIQLNEGGGQAARKDGAGGCGDGGAGGRGGDRGDKRKGQGGGGGCEGGGTRGGGVGGVAGGGGQDGSSDGERDDNGSGGEGDGDEEMEELEESSQSRIGMFGQPRSDRNQDLTVGVFSTSTNGLGRMKTFYVDSGAGNHVTWNGDVLFHYPQHLSVNTAIKSITGVSGSSLAVGGIGYIASAGGSLDRVLFVPDSAANLVSVSQLSSDYSVSVGFYIDKLWIERIASGERIGHGYRVGRLYVLDRFEAECLVQQNQARPS